jgi:hypothetical protein
MRKGGGFCLRRGRRSGEAMSYVRSKLDWVENIPEVKGYGSEPGEKTVDATVTHWFNRHGMSWYRENANSLLKLRP